MKEKIDTDKINALQFLMILTWIGDFAHRSKYGVHVLHIGCLKTNIKLNTTTNTQNNTFSSTKRLIPKRSSHEYIPHTVCLYPAV